MGSPHDSIAMMQIDCEVTATQLVHIHKSQVPEHLLDNSTTFSQHGRSTGAEDPTQTQHPRAPPSVHRFRDRDEENDTVH